MSKIIWCDKCGEYCCDDSGFTVNNDPLILRAANLPPTNVLMVVDKEEVPSGYVIGGDVNCVVIRKPGCYRLDIDCQEYVGPAPPLGGITEVVYSCEPNYDNLTELLDRSALGGTSL